MSENNNRQNNHNGAAQGPAGQGPAGPGARGRGGPMGGGGPMHGMGAVEKAKDFKGTMKNLLRYLKPFRLSIIIVILFALGSTVFFILGPKILGEAITATFEGFMGIATGAANAGIDFARIGGILLTLAVLYGISSLFMFVQGYIMSGVAQKVTYNMRLAISKKVNVLPLKYFDRVTHGEVLSRVTNDVDTVSVTLSQSMSQIITSVASILGVLYMMFSISFFMTLVALVVMPIAFFIVSRVIKRSQVYFKQQQKYLGHVNGHVEEVYGGHVIVKAYNGEEGAIKQFDEYNGMLYKSAWRSQFLSGMMMPVMLFVGNLGYVAVSILGGYFVIQKAITVGDIAAFIQYMRSFTQPIAQVAQIANILQSTAAAAERVFEFISEDEEIEETDDPVRVEHPQGRVEFDHVRFGYSLDKIIIKDFSVVIEPGQRIAIVGPTGAGKTTIVKLLMRFYDVNGGSVKVEGNDVREYLRGDLREMFGMVLQDSWLFNGTIMENIRYGRPDATDEEVIEAARAAHVDHFIHTLPGGYQMELNEETTNISQGQKQLITIARAILADPHMLILDEATSSVDIRTEAHIQRAMEQLMQGRTSFIIAHRLSTIKDADHILVMRDGDIVEQGTHTELLAQNGFYASLYYSQFENPAAS